MTKALPAPRTALLEPSPSLIFDMVADITILQTVVAGLVAHGDSAMVATVRTALAKLAVSSVQAGQTVPLIKVMDDAMQRRIVAFETKLPRQDVSSLQSV